MNLTRAGAVELAAAVVKGCAEIDTADVAVCPPGVYLEAVAAVVAGSKVGLGGQNMYHETSGAYTGELAAPMLLDVGCRYVILGHSERRQYFAETDENVNKKVKTALAAGLTAIVCIGETLDQRQAGQTIEVIRRQFAGSLAGLSAEEMGKIVLAYEPIWAIGTGHTATPEQAEEVHLDLRNIVEERYNQKVAAGLCIQYGGSVKGDNAADLMAQPDIDGALVGGASLKAEEFLRIVQAAA